MLCFVCLSTSVSISSSFAFHFCHRRTLAPISGVPAITASAASQSHTTASAATADSSVLAAARARTRVAFSEPTADGVKLAAALTGRQEGDVLVYGYLRTSSM